MTSFGSGDNPFEGILENLMRAMSATQSGPINMDLAKQIALITANPPTEEPGDQSSTVANQDLSSSQSPMNAAGFDFNQQMGFGVGGPSFAMQSEPNVDPTDRIELQNLLRIAELQVSQATGLETANIQSAICNRTHWVQDTLGAWKPVFEALATSLSSGLNNAPEPDPSDPMAAMASMSKMLGPSLIAMQVGGMVGQMATRALGSYDFPIPRVAANAGAPTLQLVAPNIAAIANDWDLPKDQLGLYIAVGETVRCAVMNRQPFAARLGQLLVEYAGGFRPDSAEAQERFSNIQAGDATDFAQMMGNPRALLGAIQTDEQRVTLLRTNALISAFVGYVDHMTDKITRGLVPTHSAIEEVLKRRRVEETDAQRLGEELLGLELSQQTFDRGTHFIQGVVERAGEESLTRLWGTQDTLPNPAEIDAPGLWLARIDLPE